MSNRSATASRRLVQPALLATFVIAAACAGTSSPTPPAPAPPVEAPRTRPYARPEARPAPEAVARRLTPCERAAERVRTAEGGPTDSERAHRAEALAEADLLCPDHATRTALIAHLRTWTPAT
jgi:hypothetical protein